jgi:hypothetical protein
MSGGWELLRLPTHAFRVGLIQALGATADMSELWGPIAASSWRETPCIVGRPATEADVAAGYAVFCVPGKSAAAPMALPSCAIQSLEDGSKQPVVVVQAELAPHGIILGVRPLAGGNCICMAPEVRLLPDGFGP